MPILPPRHRGDVFGLDDNAFAVGGFDFSGGAAGDNQFGNFGTGLPAPQTRPGVVPAATPLFAPRTSAGSPGQTRDATTVSSLFPQFTQDFFNFISSQMGQGATPFNLSSALPSGGATQPGDLSAGTNPILRQLQDFYSGTGSGPTGFSTIADFASSGLPIDQMPAWEAMIKAQQQNIEKNAANLREQFAFRGNLASSSFGNAAAQFYEQSALEQNALLGQMTTAASEAARQRQLAAGQFLSAGGAQLGEYLQSLDQDSIDRLLAEFIRTRPEYSPFLNMLFAGATSFPPYFTENFGIGATGALLQGVGTAAQGVADIIDLIKNKDKKTTNPPTFDFSYGGGG